MAGCLESETNSVTEPKTCCFCGLAEDDELQYGKFHAHEDIITHYYCLLLSSSMEQRGSDDEGILGFLTMDIKKELRRGKRLFCSYCKRNGATLGCCNTRCKRIFHLPCGLQAGSLHQYFGEFRSYCVRHRLKQNIDEHIKKEVETTAHLTCYICYEDVNPHNNLNTLWAPCCRKNAWFHRKCVQQLAMSAGYFFKCPLCNNKEEFQKAMLDCGIFIPHQDASWELVPNAYQELLHRHDRCDATQCSCPHGRSHTSRNAKWELVLCRLCGSQGIHMACGQLKWANPMWECSDCREMLSKSHESSLITTNIMSKETDLQPVDSDSDSDITVGGNSPIPRIEENYIPIPIIATSLKMRPGPRSSKLRQIARFIRGEGSTVIESHKSEANEINSSHPESDTSFLTVKKLPLENTILCEDTNIPDQDNRCIPESSILCSTESSSTTVATAQNAQDIIVVDSEEEIIEILDDATKQCLLDTIDLTQIMYPKKVSHPRNISGPPRNAVCVSCPPNGCTDSEACLHQLGTYTSQPIGYSLTECETSVVNTVDSQGLLTNEEELNIISDDATSNEPVLGLKITNVTSLAPDEFRRVFEDESSADANSTNEMVTKDIWCNASTASTDLSYSAVHNQQVKNEAVPTSTVPCKLAVFQIVDSATKEPNSKRKPQEAYMIDKSVFNSPSKNALEQSKKSRLSSTENESVISHDRLSWRITIPENNEHYAITMTTLPNTQQAQTLYATANGVPIRLPLTNGIIQTRNGAVEDEWSTFPSAASQNESIDEKCIPVSTGAMTNGELPANEYNNCHGSDVSNHPVNKQSEMQIRVRTLPLHDNPLLDGNRRYIQTNITDGIGKIGRPVSEAQDSLTTAQHLPYTARQSFERPTATNTNMTICNESSTLTGSISVVSSKPNPNTPKGIVLDSNYGSSTIIKNGCAGDAGSSPAAQAGSHQRATECQEPATSGTKSDSHSSIDHVQAWYKDRELSYIFNDTRAVPINQRPNSCTPKGRRYRHRSRVIPEKVSLRDLKFRIHGSERVQMVVYNTFTVNIRPNDNIVQNVSRSTDANVSNSRLSTSKTSTSIENLMRCRKTRCSYFRGTMTSKKDSFEYDRSISVAKDSDFTIDRCNDRNSDLSVSGSENNVLSSSNGVAERSNTGTQCFVPREHDIRKRSFDKTDDGNTVRLKPWLQEDGSSKDSVDSRLIRTNEIDVTTENRGEVVPNDNMMLVEEGTKIIANAYENDAYRADCVQEEKRHYTKKNKDLCNNEMVRVNEVENISFETCGNKHKSGVSEDVFNNKTSREQAITSEKLRIVSSFDEKNKNLSEDVHESVYGFLSDHENKCCKSLDSNMSVSCCNDVENDVDDRYQVDCCINDLNVTTLHDNGSYLEDDNIPVQNENIQFSLDPRIGKLDQQCSDTPDSMHIEDASQVLVSKNTSNFHESICSVKVQIDLNKIQNLISARPELFNRLRDKKRDEKEDESEIERN